MSSNGMHGIRMSNLSRRPALPVSKGSSLNSFQVVRPVRSAQGSTRHHGEPPSRFPQLAMLTILALAPSLRQEQAVGRACSLVGPHPAVPCCAGLPRRLCPQAPLSDTHLLGGSCRRAGLAVLLHRRGAAARSWLLGRGLGDHLAWCSCCCCTPSVLFVAARRYSGGLLAISVLGGCRRPEEGGDPALRGAHPLPAPPAMRGQLQQTKGRELPLINGTGRYLFVQRCRS